MCDMAYKWVNYSPIFRVKVPSHTTMMMWIPLSHFPISERTTSSFSLLLMIFSLGWDDFIRIFSSFVVVWIQIAASRVDRNSCNDGAGDDVMTCWLSLTNVRQESFLLSARSTQQRNRERIYPSLFVSFIHVILEMMSKFTWCCWLMRCAIKGSSW